MWREEVILTTFEMIQTHGFIVLMFLIWGTSFLFGIPIIYFLNKTKAKEKRKC